MKLELIQEILKLEEEIIAKGIKFESIFKMVDDKDELANLKEDMEIALASHQEEVEEEETIEEGDTIRSKNGTTEMVFHGVTPYGKMVVYGLSKRGRTIRRVLPNLDNYVLVKKGIRKNK